MLVYLGDGRDILPKVSDQDYIYIVSEETDTSPEPKSIEAPFHLEPGSFTTYPNTTPSSHTTPTPTSTTKNTMSKKQVRSVDPRQRPVTTDTICTHPSSTDPFRAQHACRTHQRKLKEFPMCMACIGRSFLSGACKFASLRTFPMSIDDQFMSLTEFKFLSSAPFQGRKQREAKRDVAIEYSTDGTQADVEFLKSCVAETLSSVLSTELVHETMFGEELLYRLREAGIRPVCDGCATTIFSGHFMCCCCGREICLDCYAEWDDSQDQGWETIDMCSKKRRHTKRQMVPFSLFRQGELDTLIKDVKAFRPRKSLKKWSGRRFDREDVDGHLTFVKAAVRNITEDEFACFWRRGQPIVLTGCLEQFQMSWTPDHFIENYGEQQCMLFNCESDQMITSTVGHFFEEFLSKGPKRPIKLKVSPLFKSHCRIGLLQMTLQRFSLLYSPISRMHCPFPGIHDVKDS
jgi:hypothetical protein